MATLEKVNQSLKDQERSDKKGFEGTISAVESLNNTMQSFVKMVQLQNMKLLEAMREKQAAGAAASEDVKAEEPKNNLKMILLGIVALLGGFLKGLADSLKVYAKLFRLDKLMELIKTNLSTLRANISAGLQRILTPIRAFFSAKGAQLAAIADDFKMKTLTLIDDAKAGIQRAIQPIRNFFASSGESSLGRVIRNVVTFIRNAFMFPLEPLADLVKPFKAIFTGGDEGVSIITKIVNTIKAPFTAAIEAAQKAGGFIKSAFAIFSEGSQFMKILGTIGRVIGRVFLPLTLIMTAYDTIKGAIQGFEEDGFLGGLAGAIKGLLQSVIGMPLDLLKSAVSWILGKFGLDSAEKFLDSFSYSDIIGKMINGLVNGIIEGIAILADSLPFVGKSAGEKIRSFKIGQGDKAADQKGDSPKIEKKDIKEAPPETKPETKEEVQSAPIRQIPQESLFAKRARLRKEAREKRFAERVAARRNKEAEELDAMGGAGGAVKTQNVVNAPTSSVQNNNTANNQTIVSPPTTSHDGGDPRYTDPMPWD
jgi:hypothetical protein